VIAKLKQQPRLNGALVAACVALIVLAYLAVGPASQSSGQSTRTAPVQHGVVQSTVSGTGNVQAASQLNLGFKTSGTVTHIYVKQGQHVVKGQLLATVDPQSAEVTLEQAKASLQSAEANAAKEEEGSTATTATTASVTYATNAAAPTGTTTGTTTAPSTSAPKTTTAPAGTTTAPSKSTTTAPSSNGSATSGSAPSGGSSSGAGASGGSTSAPTQSAATIEANLASAKASVKADQLVVQSDEKALADTKLYAPETGTIVTLSGEVGETVSGTGTTRASSATSSASAGSTSGAGGAGAAAGASASSSSSSGSSTTTPFAVLSDLSSLQLVVPLSESEIGSVKVGQIATATIEALSGRKVAAHVLSTDQLPASTSGVVSYDVTFQLDQGATGVKPGMSATAEVVVKQEEGLNVPSSAISRGSVTVVRGGKHVTQPVTTGLVGNSATVVLSGLKAGEEVVLPTSTATTGAAATRGRTGAAAGGFAGGGLAGGGGGFAGGGGGFAGGGGAPAGAAKGGG
jgi:multidrug efflux pump subunit AcrA (membrane-fusion protein)